MASSSIAHWWSRLDAAYTRVVRFIVMALAVLAATGIVAMIVITCLDVVLRKYFNRPVVGAYDMVCIAGLITITGALPYVTAVKGHVAIEYFFHKLSSRGRVIVDSICRSLGIAFFAFLTWQSIVYASSLKAAGQVSATLQIPLFWVPYVIAFSCGIVCLVVFYELTHPGKETIKP